MRRNRRLSRQANLERSSTFIYCIPKVKSLTNKGEVKVVHGVKFMASRYNSGLAALIEEEDNKFPSSEPTITLKY